MKSMRKIISVVFALILGTTLSFAQQQPKDSTSIKSEDSKTQKEKVKIKIEELPEPVKQALEDEKFKGWMINAAFHDPKKNQYQVELKNGVERQVVKFNTEGKRLND
jgi:hypothetical protein